MLRDCALCGELVVLTDGSGEWCECGAFVDSEDEYSKGPADQELWEDE